MVEGGDSEDDTEEASRAMVVPKVDSGASHHYANESVPLEDKEAITHRVAMTADANRSIDVNTEGVFDAVANRSTGRAATIRVQVKQSKQFWAQTVLCSPGSGVWTHGSVRANRELPRDRRRHASTLRDHQHEFRL